MTTQPAAARHAAPSRPKHLFAVCRLAWAGALLAAPDRLVAADGGQTDARSRAVARALGARHALQATVELVSWPRWRRTGVAVDVLHAATGVALAAMDQPRRRVAITDAAIATVFALVGYKL
ncbi:MAG TPA: hypothetical protein VME46_13760 [Acidimicrobiales bacterium]|nr:hypothetical protein [Acidimicrobiales bacterium]